MPLKLKFACGEYDRKVPFRTGDVRPKDVELEYTPQAPELTFYEQLKDLRWDVCEMSKRKIHDENPWVARNLFDAVEEAKDRAVASLYELNALDVAAPFIVHDVERTRQLIGMDYWPFGVKANEHCISTFVRHLHEQEIIATKLDIAKLFVNLESSKSISVSR
jgi:hypothetical protein